jgi:hypothetical protein
MRINTKSVLWTLLILTLVLSFSGIYIRMTNEAKNKTVITVADYGEFKKSANLSHRDMNDVLQKLKDSGVGTIAVGEVTLRDLANNGDVRLSSFAEFSGLVKNYFPQTWEQAQKAIGDTTIDPVNLTVVTSNPKTARFLQERLSSRFSRDELISFKANGQSYFIITSELDAFNTEVTQNDKNKTVVRELDAQLGFDDNVLKKLKSMGFDIILRPANNTGSNPRFLAEYQKYVKEYNVKLIIFAGNKLSRAPHIGWAEQLVKKNKLTVGIIENTTVDIATIKTLVTVTNRLLPNDKAAVVPAVRWVAKERSIMRHSCKRELPIRIGINCRKVFTVCSFLKSIRQKKRYFSLIITGS